MTQQTSGSVASPSTQQVASAELLVEPQSAENDLERKVVEMMEQTAELPQPSQPQPQPQPEPEPLRLPPKQPAPGLAARSISITFAEESIAKPEPDEQRVVAPKVSPKQAKKTTAKSTKKSQKATKKPTKKKQNH